MNAILAIYVFSSLLTMPLTDYVLDTENYGEEFNMVAKNRIYMFAFLPIANTVICLLFLVVILWHWKTLATAYAMFVYFSLRKRLKE